MVYVDPDLYIVFLTHKIKHRRGGGKKGKRKTDSGNMGGDTLLPFAQKS